MLSNLVFVSGPHGSGKSTLIKELLKETPNSCSPTLVTSTPRFYWGNFKGKIDYQNRQALKCAQRAIENYEYFSAAIQNPNKLIFGDRCIYDLKAYVDASISLDWMKETEKEEVLECARILFPKELHKPLAIVLNPGFEICKERIEKRWEETEWVKFMETDENYLQAVCNAFENYRGRKKIFYIESEEVDRKQHNQIREWVDSFSD